jgi:hypothetical protein
MSSGRKEPLLAKADGDVVSGVLVQGSDEATAAAAKAESRSMCVSVCALAFSIPALIGA